MPSMKSAHHPFAGMALTAAGEATVMKTIVTARTAHAAATGIAIMKWKTAMVLHATAHRAGEVRARAAAATVRLLHVPETLWEATGRHEILRHAAQLPAEFREREEDEL